MATAIIEMKTSFHVIQNCLRSFLSKSQTRFWLDYFGSREYDKRHIIEINGAKNQSRSEDLIFLIVFYFLFFFLESVNEWMTYGRVTVSNLLNWSFVTFPLILARTNGMLTKVINLYFIKESYNINDKDDIIFSDLVCTKY